MKFLLTQIFLLVFTIIWSQPNIQWQKTIGGQANDIIEKITIFENGYVLGGTSNSNISGEKTQNSWGSVDCWILILNSDGQIQWQKTIGGSLSDVLYDVKVTSDNKLIIAASSSSDISGDKTENSKGGFDYWLFKLNIIGDIQWQKTIGGNSSDFLVSVQETSDGGYILGGQSNSNISGDKTENSRGVNGSYDYWIIKTNAVGNIQWQKTIGGESIDELHIIKQTFDGGFIVGGQSSSNISYEKSENCRGDFDYWILKLNENGLIEWQRTLGGTGGEYLNDIIQTNDGNFLIGGFSNSDISGDKTENSKGGFDFWTLKLNPSGETLWQKTIGGSDADFLYSVIETTDNHYLLSGSSHSSISGDKSENSRGSVDFWILKINDSQEIIWQKTIGGDQADTIYSIKQTDDHGFFIGGNSRSNISGEKTQNCRGETDYWVMKLQPDVLSIDENNISKTKVFPNPTSKTLNFTLNDNFSNGTISISDISGRILKSFSFRSKSFSIDIEGNSGIYFATVKN